MYPEEKCGTASTTSWSRSTSATASTSSLPSWTPSGTVLVRKISEISADILGKVQTPSCNCLKKCFQDFRKCECWCTITSDKEKLVKNGNSSCRCNTMCYDENSWKDKEFCKKHPWDTRLSKCQKLLNIEHFSNTDEKQPAPLFGARNCVFSNTTQPQ